eukprot:TCALIF_08455-PA protein Name:"Similar to PNPT1 Polyribonucleotide nucleotidyltransferase 1, mitochondrial (Pongo abelii)" AED:0.05 eAED:0.05 QI:0/0/0/0.8/1/1/5/0/724
MIPPLILSCGQLAKMADGSAVMRQGDTSVLTTAVCPEGSATADLQFASFVPLTVNYKQKFAAAGRIPTNFLRREMGVSEKEILTARMIDRSIRPLFPSGFGQETQLVCNLLAVDGVHDPAVVAINAASAALAASNIPWHGPVGAVRVGWVDGVLVLNPTRKTLARSQLNLIVSGNARGEVIMLEAEAQAVDRALVLDAIHLGAESAGLIARSVADNTRDVVKRACHFRSELPADVIMDMRTLCYEPLKAANLDLSHDKQSRGVATFAIRDRAVAQLREKYPMHDTSLFHACYTQLYGDLIKDLLFDRQTRVDGRAWDQIRPIVCERDLHKPLHGSALFQRGQTQVLCTVALDSPESALKADSLSVMTGGMKEKNFFVHYEFPPYATNEIGLSTVGRRELGHGALAEKGLRAVIPSNYPFTIRLTSEVLESNGSSSMASICGGSLALLDAGVPLTQSVAGVALGLVTEYDNDEIKRHQVLVDILGLEDYLGDMDFKMAGTKDGGITALQADIKIPGLPLHIVDDAVGKGVKAIGRILDIMSTCIKEPRTDKTNLPVTEVLTIPAHKRTSFIGPGGRNLKKMQTEIGVQISQGNDESSWTIFAPNAESLAEAHEMIEQLMTDDYAPEYEFGAIITVKVLEIKERGANVELHPNLSPVFIPLTQLAAQKLQHTNALDLKVGEELQVKYYGHDPVTGSVRLSRKALLLANASAVRRLQKSARHSEKVI